MSKSVEHTRLWLGRRYLLLLPVIPIAWFVPYHDLLTTWWTLLLLPVWMGIGHLATSASYLITGFSARGAKGLLLGSLGIYGKQGSIAHAQSAFITSVFEEFVFRYALLFALIQFTQRPGLSLFISSLAFSLAHVRRLPSIRSFKHYIDYFVLGMLLGASVISTGSIYPAIVLHAMRNYILRCLLVSRKEYERMKRDKEEESGGGR